MLIGSARILVNGSTEAEDIMLQECAIAELLSLPMDGAPENLC